jgi:hypothetical protein
VIRWAAIGIAVLAAGAHAASAPAPSEAAAPSTPPPWLCKAPLRAGDFFGGAPARDLLHVRPLVRGKRARQRFDEGIAGQPAPNAFDTALPGFVDAERARAWTEHPAATLDKVAARAWPGVADRWIVIAAGRSDAVSQGLDVRLALLEVTGADTARPIVKRVARTKQPLAPRAQFGLLPEEYSPMICQDARCADPPTIEQPENVALDFAAYEIAPGERAFGVRTTWTEGYGGGYGSFEALSLFRADADRLVPILEVPVGVEKMQAGDWNDDSTRQHDMFEAELLLRMVSGAPGKAGITLAPRGGKSRQLYTWDPALGVYRCRAP